MAHFIYSFRISVFDHEFQGKYDAVGHALFYLDNITPDNDGAQSVKLYKHSWVSTAILNKIFTVVKFMFLISYFFFLYKQPDLNHCNLNISLSYKKQQETLHIVVHEANNLNLPHG